MFELLTVPYQSTNPFARRDADQTSRRRAREPETTGFTYLIFPLEAVQSMLGLKLELGAEQTPIRELEEPAEERMGRR